MATLKELHQSQFGPGQWPANVGTDMHATLTAAFAIIDAELNSDNEMHSQFWQVQACYSQPRADMMRWVEHRVWQIVKNNFGYTHCISKYGAQLLAYSIINLWIDRCYTVELREDNIEEEA